MWRRKDATLSATGAKPLSGDGISFVKISEIVTVQPTIDPDGLGHFCLQARILVVRRYEPLAVLPQHSFAAAI
jgi:hypothetical protein